MHAVEAKAEVSPPVMVEESNEKEGDVEQRQQDIDDERFGHPLLQVCRRRFILLLHLRRRRLCHYSSASLTSRRLSPSR